ncbi:MAG TPA: DUF3667 domain-containing protein [Sphingomicrobium sp.]|nr:DUF3667 domain-containing protein [Sphingomicrobium sp.]
MGEFEAIGDAVTGGLLARAVEPNAGEVGADGHTHETNCLNCGTLLSGEFCHACGQHAHVHRTLTAFFHDLLHGWLHLEGKTWRTLPLLAWKPGELTRRYIEGERARFVSPIAMFLCTVFIMFAVASLGGGSSANPAIGQEAAAELAREIEKQEEKVTQLRADRDAAARAGQPTAKMDEMIKENVQEIALARGMRSGIVKGDPDFQLKEELPPWLFVPIDKASKNPELLFYKIKTNAYKYSWALIPISVPFIWLLFPFSRRFHVYDHMVFVTYSISFMSLLVIAAALFNALGLSVLAALLFFVPPFHMYRQLKGTYGLSRSSAIWRTLLLLIFAAIALSLFGSALLGVGLFD